MNSISYTLSPPAQTDEVKIAVHFARTKVKGINKALAL